MTESADERAARLAQNEARHREVNEQLDALNSIGAELTSFGIICECGSPSCVQPLTVTKAEYEAVRVQADRFFVSHGHVFDEIETVVERHSTFSVVDKKSGIPELIAAETNPRA